AEEVLVLADLAFEHQFDCIELSRKALGLGLLFGRLANSRALHLLDDGLVRGSRFDGELARQQVVAPIAVSDFNHIAAVSELVYVFLQNDFHCISPIPVWPASQAMF